MTDETLQQVHRLQLILMLELKRLCEKHGIKYFLIAGTLLGAVRHKGFIPWDDDMDVGMLREDHTRFVAVCETELDTEKFFLQTPTTDKSFGLCFAKLQLKGTKLVERSAPSALANQGIYIDIFPFDNVPEDPGRQKKHSRKTYMQRRLVLAKLGYRAASDSQIVSRLAYAGMSLFMKFCSRDKLVRKLRREMQKYNATRTEKIVAIAGSYGYAKESIKREWVDKTVLLPFEEHEFAVPADYIAYLEYFYGDYMTPPPEGKRGNRHSIVEVDLGRYGG